MKRLFLFMLAWGTVLGTVLAHTGACFAQASGNVAYSQASGKAGARQNERSKREMAPGETPPTGTSMFIDASVLLNVRADEYVAVFGVAQEGGTVAESQQKMETTLQAFLAALKPLGIGSEDVFVDFVAQNKIYGYQIEGDVAKQKLAGFELKKTVAIHFKDQKLLDQLVIAASRAQVFDLIKVDYILKDIGPLQERLMAEAARVIAQKAARYEKLFGLKLASPPQVYVEAPSLYFPTAMYDSYAAFESENIDRDFDRSKHTVQNLRKSRTFFFNALDADGFDTVLNPVVLEPVVQCTLYLKVKYEIAPGKGGKK
jgi:uncharacterized protein YggE